MWRALLLLGLRAAGWWAEVAAAVAERYDTEPEVLLRRKGTPREGRGVAMYCALKDCRCQSRLAALARELGVSIGGLTQARDQSRYIGTARAEHDESLRETLAKVHAELVRSGK